MSYTGVNDVRNEAWSVSGIFIEKIIKLLTLHFNYDVLFGTSENVSNKFEKITIFVFGRTKSPFEKTKINPKHYKINSQTLSTIFFG